MERLQLAKEISDWTQTGTMLPKTPEDIEKILDMGVYVVLHDEKDEPIGFGAVTFLWPNGFKELGAIVVRTENRGQGIGHEIVRQLVTLAQDTYPNDTFIALCNSGSLNLFLHNGGVEVTDPSLWPSEVWGECQNCPMLREAQTQGKLCCDTPVQIKKP